MDDYGGFPMSVIVTGFFVTSLAYLICFCCCIIQFFLRRNRALQQNHGQNIFGQNIHMQKNDTLKRKLTRNFAESLKRFKKTRSSLPVSFVKQEGLPSSCPICFEEYTGDIEEIFIGFIKPCKHFYHFHCIWQWLENRGNCPLCREKVKLKEDDIKGISLRNLPKYLKEKGITISKEDHVVINVSDSDSSTCGDNQNTTENEEPTTSSNTNDSSGQSNKKYDEASETCETQTVNIAVIDVENMNVSGGDTPSEYNTLDSHTSSGSSEVYVRNTQASVHFPPENQAETPEPNPSFSTRNEPVMATRIEIRSGTDQGIDNMAYQNCTTDPV